MVVLEMVYLALEYLLLLQVQDADPTSSAIRMHGKNYQNTSSDRTFTAYSVTGDLA